MSARLPEQDYQALQQAAGALDPHDASPAASVVRAQVATFRDWSAHNEARTHLRWAYNRFFQDYDILLTPMTASAAFPHDQSAMDGRRITVNNEEQPYFLQLFWAGFTGVCFLPSTIIPTGPNAQGLPIGVQIAGPEYGDRITLKAAQLLEDAGFKFQPAPNYAA